MKGRWTGVCGELAGHPLAAPLLIGLGVTELSMSAPAIPHVKQVVRRTDLVSARALAEKALAASSAAEVRELLRGHAAKG
jgi:phosphoenolpyruvate-protein kinase (PTS system EI component)